MRQVYGQPWNCGFKNPPLEQGGLAAHEAEQKREAAVTQARGETLSYLGSIKSFLSNIH
jgi:hypothetical protein